MKKAKITKDGRNSKAKEKPEKKGSGLIKSPPPQATPPPMAKIPKKPPTDEEV